MPQPGVYLSTVIAISEIDITFTRAVLIINYSNLKMLTNLGWSNSMVSLPNEAWNTKEILGFFLGVFPWGITQTLLLRVHRLYLKWVACGNHILVTNPNFFFINTC